MSLFRFLFPQRRWVVESRPRSFPAAPWEKSLGPYWRWTTARDMMNMMRLFAPASLVALRVRDIQKERES